MAEDAAHNGIWQTSDAIFGVALLVGVALSFLLPLPLPDALPRALYYVLGVGLAAPGVVFVVLSKRHLDREQQPSEPGKPTTRLITSGVFAISRNPLYLGLTLIFAGLGCFFNTAWLLLLLVPVVIAVHFILIVPEERYLATKFGADFDRYRAAVRRWI